jgi:hypothetical protein
MCTADFVADGSWLVTGRSEVLGCGAPPAAACEELAEVGSGPWMFVVIQTIHYLRGGDSHKEKSNVSEGW